MEDLGDKSIGRREFIAGAGVAMLGGCVSCPAHLAMPRAPGTFDLSDVHAHFFNLSDLPVRGFIRDVLVPNRAPGIVGIADALGDLGHFLKQFAPTVSAEGRGLYSRFEDVPERHVPEEDYARHVADRINAQAAVPPVSAGFTAGDGAPLFGADLNLAQSYGALAIVLDNPAPGPGFVAPSVDAVPPVSPARILEILADTGDAAAASFVGGDGSPCAMKMVQCPDSASEGCAAAQCEEPDSTLEIDWARAKALIKWLWEMMQGRCNHVRRYLATTRSDAGDQTWRPHLVVHHLVDYDEWLGDAPDHASSHDAQIAFWTRFGRERRDELHLVTFGGFDPLKYAQERIANQRTSSGRLTQFDRLQGAFNNTGPAGPKISGFKIYPPMGFKPWGNRACDYRGRERARGIVSRRWSRAPYLGRDIGEEINLALAEFYRFCITHRAPVLSHSILGNQAACCFGQRANPSHWADLFERHPEYRGLRLCLGHIVNDARCFIHAIDGLRAQPSRPAPDHVWALHGTARLLEMSRAGQADVYADIGYLSEILAGERQAVEFFGALRWYCEQYDPGCRRILFGTDWIMIEQEVGYRRYVDLIRQGMTEAGWPSEWQQNLLSNNLRDFLGLQT